MTIREIRVVPDPVLRTPCDPVTKSPLQSASLSRICSTQSMIPAEPACPPTKSA